MILDSCQQNGLLPWSPVYGVLTRKICFSPLPRFPSMGQTWCDHRAACFCHSPRLLDHQPSQLTQSTGDSSRRWTLLLSLKCIPTRRGQVLPLMPHSSLLVLLPDHTVMGWSSHTTQVAMTTVSPSGPSHTTHRSERSPRTQWPQLLHVRTLLWRPPDSSHRGSRSTYGCEHLAVADCSTGTLTGIHTSGDLA